MSQQALQSDSHSFGVGMKLVELDFRQPLPVEEQPAWKVKDILYQPGCSKGR